VDLDEYISMTPVLPAHSSS